MEELVGRKVLITGGTTGIGRATAVLLAKYGADILIFGRHQKELEDALNDIERLGGKKALGTIADVASLDAINSVFDIVDKTWGKLDVLVNNAALPARSVTDHDYKTIKYILDVNITGYLVCTKMALERMLPRNEGHIINMGSMSAHVREAEANLYVTTKSAIAGFNEAVRKLVNDRCVKVSVIEPGSVGTDMVGEPPSEQRFEEEQQYMLKAEDIAESILFCLTRPKRCDVISIQIKPHRQII
jgi:NADP-dependent 3-hydroxy acid dehydrogenase YdfG